MSAKKKMGRKKVFVPLVFLQPLSLKTVGFIATNLPRTSKIYTVRSNKKITSSVVQLYRSKCFGLIVKLPSKGERLLPLSQSGRNALRNFVFVPFPSIHSGSVYGVPSAYSTLSTFQRVKLSPLNFAGS